jgi:hypothetical protein
MLTIEGAFHAELLEMCIQGVTNRCRLSWLTNSALVHEPKYRWGGGGVEGPQPEQLCTWSQNKLWISNSILYIKQLTGGTVRCRPVWYLIWCTLYSLRLSQGLHWVPKPGQVKVGPRRHYTPHKCFVSFSLVPNSREEINMYYVDTVCSPMTIKTMTSHLELAYICFSWFDSYTTQWFWRFWRFFAFHSSILQRSI